MLGFSNDIRVLNSTYLFNELIGLSLILIPVNLMIAGNIYVGSGKAQTSIASILVVLFAIVIFFLYLLKPFIAYLICSSIAISDFFSLLPYTVYKIEGVARLDDIALVLTLFYIAFMRNRKGSVTISFKREILFLASYMLLQAVYTILISGTSPLGILRETRGYIQIFWVFTVPFFIKRDDQVANFMRFMLVGTLFNILMYSIQVVFKIRLGYVDSQSYLALNGNESFRVWQGFPDTTFLLMGMSLGYILSRGKKNRRWSFIIFFASLSCLLLSNIRVYLFSYLAGLILVYVLNLRPDIKRRRRKLSTVVAVFLIGAMSFMIAEKLLGVGDVLLSRFTSEGSLSSMISSDANLAGRLLFLGEVFHETLLYNPLLGFGFVSAGAPILVKYGINYFGSYTIRNNDIGAATIFGQGGWLFVVILLVLVFMLSIKLWNIRKKSTSLFVRNTTVSLIVFMLCQIPISFANLGLTSGHIWAIIGLGIGLMSVCFKKERKENLQVEAF